MTIIYRRKPASHPEFSLQCEERIDPDFPLQKIAHAKGEPALFGYWVPTLCEGREKKVYEPSFARIQFQVGGDQKKADIAIDIPVSDLDGLAEWVREESEARQKAQEAREKSREDRRAAREKAPEPEPLGWSFG